MVLFVAEAGGGLCHQSWPFEESNLKLVVAPASSLAHSSNDIQRRRGLNWLEASSFIANPSSVGTDCHSWWSYIGYKFRFLLISRDRIFQGMSELMFKVKYCGQRRCDATRRWLPFLLLPGWLAGRIPRFEKFNYPPVSHTHSFIHWSGQNQSLAAAILQPFNVGLRGNLAGVWNWVRTGGEMRGVGYCSKWRKSLCFKFGSKSTEWWRVGGGDMELVLLLHAGLAGCHSLLPGDWLIIRHKRCSAVAFTAIVWRTGGVRLIWMQMAGGDDGIF